MYVSVFVFLKGKLLFYCGMTAWCVFIVLRKWSGLAECNVDKSQGITGFSKNNIA